MNQGFIIYGPNNSTAGTNARTIAIGRANSSTVIGPGLYRAIPLDVLSSNVVGLPPVETPAYCGHGSDIENSMAFYFRVGPDCDLDGVDDQFLTPTNTNGCLSTCADFNGIGGVTVQDVFDFIAAWFATCVPTGTPPALPCGCMGNADFNRDGTLAVQDIFDFLTAWFAGNNACH